MTDSPAIEDIQFATEPDVGEIPGPKSRKLLEEQRTYDSSAVAYPTTSRSRWTRGSGRR